MVTGRHHVAIHPFYQALETDTPAICCNGTYLYDYPAWRAVTANPLDEAQTLTVLDLLDYYAVYGLL